jgi:hypothetical protein
MMILPEIKGIAPLAVLPSKIAQSPRLTIRADEKARRRIADTDGTRRRAAQTARNNEIL